MGEEDIVKKIVELTGGTDNIVSAVNCMTRLRFTVREEAAVREDELKAVESVLGVVHNQKNYYEVVVGPKNSRSYMAICRNLGLSAAAQSAEAPRAESAPEPQAAADAKKAGKVSLKSMMKTFGGIFAPLIPGSIAAGLCAGVVSLITQTVPGYADIPALVVLCQLLMGIRAAFMTYLAAWTGYRTAEMFGGTPILGGMVGMFTMLENVDVIAAVVGLYNEAEPLNAILRAGRGGVLAAVAGVWLMCRVEAAVRKRFSGAAEVIFAPLVTLLVTLIPYVFLVMPALGCVSMALCRMVGAVATASSPVVRMLAGYLGAALFLPMVAMGMHHGLIALYSVQLETFGYVTLYPALAMAGAGQVGAALAIAVKAKKTGNQSLLRTINGALPVAVLGIGEPLIYGVTLPLGKPFLTAGLGAGFGGAFVMLMEVASTTWGPSGVLGTFVMTEGPHGALVSIGCYLVGLVVSCALAFVITALTVKQEQTAVQD